MSQTESLTDTDDSDDQPLNPSDSSLGQSSTSEDSHSEMPIRNKLVGELGHLSDQVDVKRAELDSINAELNLGLDRFNEEFAKEERKRDELSAEVTQMKMKIHLLATDLNNKDDSNGRKGFPSIFRSLSGGSSTSSGDVEMKTIRAFYQQSSTGRIQELEKELRRERSRLDGCVQKRNEWKEQVEQLSTANQLLCQDNDRLQVEKEDMEQQTHEIERLRQENDQLLAVQEKGDSDGVEQLKHEVARLRQENERLQIKIAWGDSGNKKQQLHDENERLHRENERLAAVLKKDDASPPSTSQGPTAKILSLVERAIDESNKRGSSVASTNLSCYAVEPKEAEESSLVDLVSPLASEADNKQVFISNLDQMQNDPECSCGSAKLFEKKEYVEFYLPMLGMTCTCGKKKIAEIPSESDPCALESILRGWQTEFLYSIGITDTIDFVHACNQRRGLLAKEMKRWRKAKGMPAMKTQACAIALYIWSKTCKAVAKRVAEQAARGVEKPVRPDFLDICVLSDGASMSTMDMGSVNLRLS
jgi:hypothetical protein